MELRKVIVYGFLTFTAVSLVALLVCACLLIAAPGLFNGAGLPNHRICVGNTTRPTCRVDVGDIVAIECPGNTSAWERDGRVVCDNSTCILDGLEPDDFGLYTCGEYELVLVAGHAFGTQIKNGYSLLVYALAAMIVFVVSFGALTSTGQQITQKYLPSRLRKRKMKSYYYISVLSIMVFLMVIGFILIIAALVPRDKSCGFSDNSTVFTCTPCVGDNVHLECPVNTSYWKKDNRTVCEDFMCTLGKVSKGDRGFYQCADYGIVVAVEIGDCVKSTLLAGWMMTALASVLFFPIVALRYSIKFQQHEEQMDAVSNALEQLTAYRARQVPQYNPLVEEDTLPIIAPVPQGTTTGQLVPQAQEDSLPRPQHVVMTHNTAHHNMPEWFELICTLGECTHSQQEYHNEDNDFRLVIPEGAIPVGDSITIDIGVALFGPFQYPPNIRPVSPVFWVSVRGHQNYRFLEPLRVTIGHCLKLCDDSNLPALGLTFMTALYSEGRCLFSATSEKQDFLTDFSRGTLEDQFQCVSVCANTYPATSKLVLYRLSVSHPREVRANGHNHTVHLITTFSLKYCTSKLKKAAESANMFFCMSQEFMFNYSSDEVALSIDYATLPPTNVHFQLTTERNIYVADIEFHNKDIPHLEEMASSDLYPPRFSVDVSGSDMTTQSNAHFVVSGAAEELDYNLTILPITS